MCRCVLLQNVTHAKEVFVAASIINADTFGVPRQTEQAGKDILSIKTNY